MLGAMGVQLSDMEEVDSEQMNLTCSGWSFSSTQQREHKQAGLGPASDKGSPFFVQR